ncbi:MAG: fimbrillin family protein, partial [Proteiniphilum sp.]|nr:fimbrillin family protein [Proteiniphilum sp.]
MKQKLFILMMGFLLFACEGEEINPTGMGTAIRLTAQIEGMRTRLSGSTWEKGDAIGVYMKLNNAPLDSSAPEQNVRYIYDAETGQFKA